ncbi:MAG: hypothetical protein GY757_26550 [bacterium]|nr:hypothetical protein [bacterium]
MFEEKQELLEKISLGEASTLELKSLHFRGSKIVGPCRTPSGTPLITAGGLSI